MDRNVSRRLALPLLALAVCLLAPSLSIAESASGSQSFVDDFDKFDRARWYVSDGWDNGAHQNCTWSKKQLKSKDGVLTLSFEKRKAQGSRLFLREKSRPRSASRYGVYEARMKTEPGSGLNAAFFTYIGPTDKQPHDEIDFEVLTKDPSRFRSTPTSPARETGKTRRCEGRHRSRTSTTTPSSGNRTRLSWYVNGELVQDDQRPRETAQSTRRRSSSASGAPTR